MSIINANEFESLARQKLDKSIFDFYASGAMDGLTVSRNLEVFKKILLVPRVLRDTSKIQTEKKLFGNLLDMPILIAPTAFHRAAHPDGEIASVGAATRSKIGMITSCMSTVTLEHISATANCLKWFQLYLFKNKKITENLVRRAEKANYQAIVLTVDVPIMGRREQDIKNNFVLPDHIKPENFLADEYLDFVRKQAGSSIKNYTDEVFDKSFNWQDLEWLKKLTKLPIILKGIMHEEDVDIALEMDIAGIIISNHGGRQLDSMPSAVEMLPNIVSRVKKSNKNMPILVDGGFRRGTDVYKAIALGADGILLGRPILWALAVGGEQGVVDLLNIYKKELEETMIFCGCRNIEEIQTIGSTTLKWKEQLINMGI